MKYKIVSFLTLLFVLLVVGTVHASDKVAVEYFYIPGCEDCAKVSPLIREINSSYVDQVTVEWVDVETYEGLNRFTAYNFTEVPAVMINHEYRILEGEITAEKLKEVIEAYLNEGKVILPKELYLSIPIALSMGLFSGFSPCLMAILAFILTYTTGTGMNWKGGLVRALIFGLGLLTAYMLVGAFILALRISVNILAYLNIITWAVSLIMILMGLNLLGALKFLKLSTKPLVQRLLSKHGTTFVGLFALGMLFSFMLPCGVPFFLVLLANIALGTGTAANLILLVAFSVGVLIPFLGVGLVGGGAPNLAKRIRYGYRTVLRSISGLIMIGIAVWLLISNLIVI